MGAGSAEGEESPVSQSPPPQPCVQTDELLTRAPGASVSPEALHDPRTQPTTLRTAFQGCFPHSACHAPQVRISAMPGDGETPQAFPLSLEHPPPPDAMSPNWANSYACIGARW